MKRRIVYIDLIRIIAAYLVIFTHTAELGSKIYVVNDYGVIRNTVYLIADILRTVNVPLFFMVSGALLLGKEEPYNLIFKKYFIKYLVVIVAISYLYYAVYPLSDNNWRDIATFAKVVYNGPIVGVFWFLYTYWGYLLILPFLRKIVCSMTDLDYKYLLILGLVFKCLFPIIDNIFLTGGIGITCNLMTDSIFYPIMGYYVANVMKTSSDRSVHIWGILLSICSILVVALLTQFDKSRNGVYSENYLFSCTVIPAIYMFYMMKSLDGKLSKCPIFCKIINCMGNCSFGVYLFGLFIQVVLVKTVYRKIYACMPDLPLVAGLLYVGVVVFVGIAITYLLKKTPIIKRFI